MKIRVISLFPSLYKEFCETSLVGRAQKNELAKVDVVSLLSYAHPGERVDAPVVGHGAGMLIKPEIVAHAMRDAGVSEDKPLQEKPFVVFFSPHGSLLDQKKLKELYHKIEERGSSVVLFASRYEGVDARAEEEYADEVLSIGNYVLMGGDLPALVFIESILRLVPGVVGDAASVTSDSFENIYVDHPHYANPDVWHDKQIPSVLKSGDHKKIAEWRDRESRDRTVKKHFQWLRTRNISHDEKKDINCHIPSHYCALLHNEVMLPDNRVGHSSVTSIDIHDLARSATAYGLKHYFVVTELTAQQRLVEHFLSFWHDGEGLAHNEKRHRALQHVSLKSNLDEVIQAIEEREGKKVLLISTSAQKSSSHIKEITYFDQEQVWRSEQPVLFLFGTSHGLAPEVINRCNFRLLPLEGFSNYNSLSVRSAAAIILDRWLGINPCYTKKVD